MPPKDIYDPKTFKTQKQYRDYNTLLDSVVDMIMTTDNRPLILDKFSLIESDNDRTKKNPESTAKGVYQFTDGTVEHMKDRALNLGFDEKFIGSIDDDPREWTRDQADIMELIKLFGEVIGKGETTYLGLKGKPGLVDSLLEKAIKDKDPTAMEDLYYTIHHTDKTPDIKTRINFERKMYDLKYPKIACIYLCG